VIHHIVDLLGIPKRDCIYDIVGLMDLRLCVDVGAGLGGTVARMRIAGGPGNRVVAFEPFQQNHEFIHERTAGLDNITLISKAVGSSVGWAEFVVPSVVQSTERGWESYAGYSSVGYLARRQGATRLLGQIAKRIVGKVLNRPAHPMLTVEATTIDAEFEAAGDEIDFMKIDVQGGEHDVLIGSAAMLKRGLINVMYIEWSGDSDMIEMLNSYGYHIYDSTYMAFPKTDHIEPFEQIGFRFQNKFDLSTGRIGYELVLVDRDASPSEAMSAVRNAGLGGIQTDLIAVLGKKLPQFMTAVGRYSDIT
jgi:FkbM family methyltransferase